MERTIRKDDHPEFEASIPLVNLPQRAIDLIVKDLVNSHPVVGSSLQYACYLEPDLIAQIIWQVHQWPSDRVFSEAVEEGDYMLDDLPATDRIARAAICAAVQAAIDLDLSWSNSDDGEGDYHAEQFMREVEKRARQEREEGWVEL